MPKPIPINQVPPDIDQYKTQAVLNPLSQDYSCKIAGRVIVVPANKAVILPAPAAEHVALHLADKICRERMNAFLQTNYQGLNEQAVEKWRTQTKIYVGVEDRHKVKQQLLLDPQVAFGQAKPKIDVPNVRREEETPTDIIETKPGEAPSGESVVDEIQNRVSQGVEFAQAEISQPVQDSAQGDSNDDEEDEDEEEEAPKPRRGSRTRK